MSSIVSASSAAQSVTPISGHHSHVGLSSAVDPAGGLPSERSEDVRPPVRVSSGRQVILDQAAFDEAISGARVSASSLPPDSNTGGKSPTLADLFHAPRLLSSDGKVEKWQIWPVGFKRGDDGSLIRARLRLVVSRDVEQAALIDTFSFTFKEAAFRDLPSCSGFVTDDDLCVMVGELLRVTIGINSSGPIGKRNFYACSRSLVPSADESVNAGFVAAGGNADTVQVHLTGEGCASISTAQWVALYALLISLDAKITRADLAHDDFEGARSVDSAVSSYLAGGFNGRGRPPGCDQRGDWLTPGGDPKGRTFYVGSRESGKALRVYEKGRQLGDPASPWVRWELELHGKDRVIPLEVVLNPGAYLSGAYPGEKGTGWISAVQSVIKTISKRLQISYGAMIRHCRTSYGRLLWVMRDIEGSADAVLDRLTSGINQVPRRLVMPPVPA